MIFVFSCFFLFFLLLLRWLLFWVTHPPLTACAEEVKDIEFTVTTLNCAQDQSEKAPEHRRKFSSLRKTGALSKAVRSKLSKSFYSNSSSNNINEKMSNISDSEKISESDSVDKFKQPNILTKSSKSISTTATATATPAKPEKYKKRSKICQLL